MTNDASESSWLENLGFKSDPFSGNHAEEERELIPNLFISPAIDESQLHVDKPLVVFATRGGGKSAIRVFLGMISAPIIPNHTTLSIEINSISTLLAEYRRHGHVPIEFHINHLLHLAVKALLAYSCGLPHLHSISRHPLKAHAGHTPPDISGGNRFLFARYLNQYWSEWLSPEVLEKIWQMYDQAFDVNVPTLQAAIKARQVEAWLKSTSLASHETAVWLARLCDQEASPLTGLSIEEQMSRFVSLAQHMGLSKVQFLIDGIDEGDETVNKPEDQAKVMQSLLSYLTVMELPHVRFRIFFQDSVQPILERSQKIRQDRLRIVPIIVKWQEADLKKLLEQRLIFFSGGITSDFSQMVEDNYVGEGLPLSDWLWQRLIAHAGQSPRQLLTALQLMTAAHQKRVDNGDPTQRFVKADWDDAYDLIEVRLRSLRQVPVLYINLRTGQLTINERHFHLTQKPFEVLRALALAAEQSNNCSIDQIIEAAWADDDPDGVIESAVTKNVQRLRQKINDIKPFNYVVNAVPREKGYRLQNYQLIE